MKTLGTIIMLPTDKASNIIKMVDGKLSLAFEPMVKVTNGNQQQHLYLSSDDEIKDGDWHYDDSDKSIKQWEGNLKSNRLLSKKIIATTDKSLLLPGSSIELLGITASINEPVSQIEDYEVKWIIEFYNKNKRFPKVAFDEMETPISIFSDEDSESTQLEDSDAGILITLRNSTIQVINDTHSPHKELLYEIRNVPKGSWDKIWEAIKSIKSVRK